MPTFGRRKNRKNVPAAPSAVALFQKETSTVGPGANVFDRADLTRRHVSMILTQNPPSGFGNHIHWRRLSYGKNVSYSGGSTEIPLSFKLSDFTGYAGPQSCFDQYCIHSISVSVSLADVSYSGSVSTDSLRYGSCIDYDNVGTGYGAAIYSFNSYQETFLTPRNAQQRIIFPYVATSTLTNSSAFVAGGVMRQWIDNAFVTVQHNGYKGILYADSFATANVQIFISGIFGFRNPD